MRRSCHGKDDWVDIKWKGGEITPTMQQDTFSCGVFVMQMAKEVAQNIPSIPFQIDIEPSKTHGATAEDRLNMSEVNKANNGFIFVTDKEPGCGPKTDWWFHVLCLGMKTRVQQSKEQTGSAVFVVENVCYTPSTLKRL